MGGGGGRSDDALKVSPPRDLLDLEEADSLCGEIFRSSSESDESYRLGRTRRRLEEGISWMRKSS